MTTSPENDVDLPAPGHRVIALDAVRGIAALSVVLAHITAMNQTVYQPGSITNWPNWFTRLTPLHLFWYGPIAVVIFFVLSGYVLTMPFLRRTHTGPDAWAAWAGFYPKRLIRLYLPAWGALIMALGIVWLEKGHHVHQASSWLTSVLPNAKIGRVAHDALLVAGISNLDSPLWTLGLEVVASMMLPAFFLLAVIKRVPVLVRVLGVLGIIGLGGLWANRSIALLGTFGLGALLAALALEDPAWIRRIRWWTWAIILVLSLVLMNAPSVLGFFHPSHHIASILNKVLPSLGSLGVVATVVFWASASRALSIRPLEWLGSRSFSLYLTHFPLVIALAFVIDPKHLLVLCLVGVAASLILAEVFTRIVERPSHALSKRVGRWASGLVHTRLANRSSDGDGAVATQPSEGSDR